MIADETVAAFEKYDVLSKRELESRFEVWVEQYAIRANIEAETTHSIAKTMILPAALRYLALIKESGAALGRRGRGQGDARRAGQRRSPRSRRPTPTRTTSRASSWPIHARDKQLAAMAEVREAADKLEKVVADDLWPLPKYEEMLFIK